MKAADFEKISKELMDHCWDIMFSKAKEYASDEDRLANFKQPTTLFHTNPAKIALFYDSKHIASMVKMADDIDKGILPSKEFLMEKVGDYINYGLLFYSAVMEMIEAQEEDKKKAEKTEYIDIVLENCEWLRFNKRDVKLTMNHVSKFEDEEAYSVGEMTIEIDMNAQPIGGDMWERKHWSDRIDKDITRIEMDGKTYLTPWDNDTSVYENSWESDKIVNDPLDLPQKMVITIANPFLTTPASGV